MDIINALPEKSEIKIIGTDDFSKIKGSKIVIITASAGVYLNDRTEMMETQVKMIKEIANQIKKYAPEAIILLVSNPLDVLTYVFQKETNFAKNKVIGVASSLDSSRFRYIISEKLSVKQNKISNALVLGEHGDSMVLIFSITKVNVKYLLEMINDKTKEEIIYEVRNYWKLLRQHKSRSQFGIAKNAYDIIETIINKKEKFVPVSTLLKGEYGEQEVCIGVPCIINKEGIVKIEEIKLNDSEKQSLKNSAKTVKEYIQSV